MVQIEIFLSILVTVELCHSLKDQAHGSSNKIFENTCVSSIVSSHLRQVPAVSDPHAKLTLLV